MLSLPWFNRVNDLCYVCSRDTQTFIADGILPVMGDPAAAARVRQVPTFEQFDPVIFKGLRKSYVRYTKHVAAVEKGTTLPPAPGLSKFKVADLSLEATGYPRVPDPIRNVNNIETNVTQQQIIRSYFRKHYGMREFIKILSPIDCASDLAAGKDGPIPYKTIVPEWKEYVDPKYFPEGISFKDPSKYLTEESNSILKLWRARRDRGEVYFRFKCVMGSDKLPDEPDYPEGIFENLRSPTVVDLGGRTSRVQRKEQSSEEESDEDQVIRTRTRITSPEEDEGSEVEGPGEDPQPDTGAEVGEPSTGAEVGERRKKVGDQRIPKRYRKWTPEEGEESDGEGQDNDFQSRSLPGIVEEDEEEDHMQNLGRGRRTQKARILSVGSDEDIATSSPKAIPRAPQRIAISPTFDSSPTLAGSSPLVRKRTGRRALLTPDSTADSNEGSPVRRTLRPRGTATTGTATAGTAAAGTAAMGTVARGKASAETATKGTAIKGKGIVGTTSKVTTKVVAKRLTGKGKKS